MNLGDESVFIYLPQYDRLSDLCAFGLAEEVESKQLAFVVRIVTENTRFGDLAAFDQLGQADESAQVGFEVKPVAFACDKVHVAFAGIQHIEELRHINIV